MRQTWTMHGPTAVTLVMLLTLMLSQGVPAATAITGEVFANVQDFGQIRVDNDVALSHAPLDQTTTSTLNANYDGGSQSIFSTVTSSLSTSVIAIGAADSNASAPGGSVIGTKGGGLITVEDEFLITSPTLAAGTPVNLQFSFYSVRSGTFTHDAFGVPGAQYGNLNGGGMRYQFTGQLTSMPAAPGPNLGFEFWSGGDHFLIEDGLLGPSTQNGLFDPLTPQFDILVAGEVGGTVDLRFRLEAAISVGTWSTGVGNVIVHTGTANAGVAIAFGASAVQPNVVLDSALYGGAFSAASEANFGNANMALTSFTPIPLPPMIVPFAIAALAMLRRARAL